MLISNIGNIRIIEPADRQLTYLAQVALTNGVLTRQIQLYCADTPPVVGRSLALTAEEEWHEDTVIPKAISWQPIIFKQEKNQPCVIVRKPCRSPTFIAYGMIVGKENDHLHLQYRSWNDSQRHVSKKKK